MKPAREGPGPLALVFSALFRILLVGLFYAPLVAAQGSPLDSSEISRDLLYVAPVREEARADGASSAYVGARFEFTLVPGQGWTVRPSASRAKEPPAKGRVFSADFPGDRSDYELVASSDDDRATLELRRKGTRETLGTATLWDRAQLVAAWLPELRRQKPGLSAASLRDDLEVADPEVRTTAALPAGTPSGARPAILVAVGQSSGEGELGLATIVRFVPDTRAVTVYHPAAGLTCEISALGAAAGPSAVDVWFGSRAVREGVVSPCGGLARLDLETREAQAGPGGRNLPVGSMVTLVGGPAGGTVVATDAGICTLTGQAGNAWDCLRFVPTAALAGETEVANRPGDKPYGTLKPGDYEVLWANQNFLEVATRDSFDAWLAADDYAEALARNFDVEPYKLLNTSSGGPSPLRLLAKPGAEAASGVLLYRAPLEKLSAPAGTPAGWVKVRARIGWIPRGRLEVGVRLLPVAR